MVWFFVSLTRQRRTGHAQVRLQVRVKATDWEPSQAGTKKRDADLPVAKVRAPIDLRRDRAVG
jgi:hypothetical protein